MDHLHLVLGRAAARRANRMRGGPLEPLATWPGTQALSILLQYVMSVRLVRVGPASSWMTVSARLGDLRNHYRNLRRPLRILGAWQAGVETLQTRFAGSYQ